MYRPTRFAITAMSSASEKLKALDVEFEYDEELSSAQEFVWNALPQIVAVIEAAEDFAEVWLRAAEASGIGHGGQTDRFRAALAALDEALT